MGGSLAFGMGVGVGVVVCGGVMETCGGARPGGVLVVLCRGGARGVGGARAYADMWIRTVARGWVGVHEGGSNGAGRGVRTLLVAPGVALVRSGVVCGPVVQVFGWRWNEVRRTSAVAGSAMKVVAAALVMAGGAVLGAAAAGPGMALVGGCRGRHWRAWFSPSARCRASAAALVWQRFQAGVWRWVWVAPWPWSWFGGRVLGCGVAAGRDFGRAVGAGFAGVRCRPALPVAGYQAAGALAVAGAPAVRTGFGAGLDGVAGGWAGAVLDESMGVELDKVVLVVAVLESEAEETDVGDRGQSQVESEVEETDVGDDGRSRTAGAGVGC